MYEPRDRRNKGYTFEKPRSPGCFPSVKMAINDYGKEQARQEGNFF
jgi:hypothetical protein